MGSLAEEDTDRIEEDMRGGKSGFQVLGASARICAGDIHWSDLPLITTTPVPCVSTTTHLD